MTRTKLDDGKYEVHHTNGLIKVYRNGEEWRDETGDGLFLAMIQKIETQNELLKHAREFLSSDPNIRPCGLGLICMIDDTTE